MLLVYESSDNKDPFAYHDNTCVHEMNDECCVNSISFACTVGEMNSVLTIVFVGQKKFDFKKSNSFFKFIRMKFAKYHYF